MRKILMDLVEELQTVDIEDRPYCLSCHPASDDVTAHPLVGCVGRSKLTRYGIQSQRVVAVVVVVVVVVVTFIS
jgi:hypothetical protein